MNQTARLPTFFILGAQKAGTTSLSEACRLHPEIGFTVPKEPRILEFNPDDEVAKFSEAYKHLTQVKNAMGEGSTWNLYLPFVAERIHRLTPSARLVICVRDPVARLHSHWWWRTTRGMERGTASEMLEGAFSWRESSSPKWSLSEWKKYCDGRAEPPADWSGYLATGYYAEQIERYLKLFKPEQLLVICFDTLRKEPNRVLSALWNHIGVSQLPSVELPHKNKNRGPLAHRLNRWALMMRLDKLLPKSYISAIRLKVDASGDKRPDFLLDELKRLNAHFAPHNQELAKLLKLHKLDSLFRPDSWLYRQSPQRVNGAQ